MALDLSFALPMQEALAFWKDKLQLSPGEFAKLSDAAKTRAFSVSGIAKGDELNTVYTALDTALKDGTTFEQFKKDAADVFERRGWTGKRAWRLDTIFRTNIQTAYNIGRYQQMQKVKDRRPYWRYSAVNDSRTRPAHRAVHGKIFPADHPFWDTWYPPNGFRCRCSVNSVSAHDLELEGWKVETTDPTGKLYEPTDPNTGVKLPARLLMPDEGWRFNPGKAAENQLSQVLGDKLSEINADIGSALFAEIKPHARKIVIKNYSDWLDAAIKGDKRKDYALLGSMGVEEVAFLKAMGKEPQSSAIVINDRLVFGKKAIRHEAAGNALTEAEWRILPDVVNDPEFILYDKTEGSLLYVYPALDDPRKIKIVVKQDVYRDKLKATANEVSTVFKIDGNALMDRTKYQPIKEKSD